MVWVAGSGQKRLVTLVAVPKWPNRRKWRCNTSCTGVCGVCHGRGQKYETLASFVGRVVGGGCGGDHAGGHLPSTGRRCVLVGGCAVGASGGGAIAAGLPTSACGVCAAATAPSSGGGIPGLCGATIALGRPAGSPLRLVQPPPSSPPPLARCARRSRQSPRRAHLLPPRCGVFRLQPWVGLATLNSFFCNSPVLSCGHENMDTRSWAYAGGVFAGGGGGWCPR